MTTLIAILLLGGAFIYHEAPHFIDKSRKPNVPHITMEEPAPQRIVKPSVQINLNSNLESEYAEKQSEEVIYLYGGVKYVSDGTTITCDSCYYNQKTGKVYDIKHLKIYSK